MKGQTSQELRIPSAVLASRGHYSCQAVNTAGVGGAGSASLEVGARPQLLERLRSYTGVLDSSQNLSLVCRVECSPSCRIAWYRNGTFIRNKVQYSTVQYSTLHYILVQYSTL